MALSDLPLVSMLKTKMQWHQVRQNVLAENVAHADTPRYRPKELKALDFNQLADAARHQAIAATRTHQMHIAARGRSDGPYGANKRLDWEVTPEGNAVSLEEQMMKVSGNQFEYQMASTLYSRSLGLIRTALGRGN